ncbi:hypothetical protein SAMN05421786_1011129 [Chryseobacterium ureilyticum]|uniref:Uncharacterized protein n=1 Tax=Chryseobacterium ureilyticum TaxID=373668 RepID=A0A1N7L9V4_9FLAO|nr:hypothetical protein SAMN05421786_1011129 [Chryseobacterium ureilyticum]
MKFNNYSHARIFLIINCFLLIITFLYLFFLIVFYNISEILLMIISLTFIVIWLINNLIFTNKIEIDSTSEVLSIIISHPFMKKHIHNSKMLTEFPKQRLVKYKIKRTLFKTNLKISFRRGEMYKPGLHNQSFKFYRLNNAQQLCLESELTKIINQNNEFI